MQRGTEVEEDKASHIETEREVSEDRSYSPTKRYELVLLHVETYNKGPTVMIVNNSHLKLKKRIDIRVFRLAAGFKVKFLNKYWKHTLYHGPHLASVPVCVCLLCRFVSNCESVFSVTYSK